ncbi:MAG: hypothetical protein GOMPHAMPRED_003419 [Gomphillus americanus]|uniref:FAD dependent oxidoreductase domain-containing protein n=1 Tax=Gomphillus americanus TaxID=1940652 RepID=A0A8H3FCX3_9LECA|nr:MAG: hypothetical protein GOMPHAMPRED_003419 [Gomphillus americanus]
MDNPESYGVNYGVNYGGTSTAAQTQSLEEAAMKLASESSSSQDVAAPLQPPDSILIIGAGVFGISTALELLRSPRYDRTCVMLVDAYAPPLEPPTTGASLNAVADGQGSPTYKKEVTASLDTSRIVRPDYAQPLYAKLADKATGLFRSGWAEGSAAAAAAAEKTYTQPGLLVISTGPEKGRGREYIESSYENTLHLARLAQSKTQQEVKDNSGVEPITLPTSSDVEACLGSSTGFLPETTIGYINPQAGWANAIAAITALKNQVIALGQTRDEEGKAPFRFCSGTKVTSLLFSDDKTRVTGAILNSSERFLADMTVLAAGAWTSSFLPSLLSPRMRASGQVLAYISLDSEDEIARYAGKPTVIDYESGMYAIYPPEHYISEKRNRGHFKVSRHGWGYAHTRTIQDPLTKEEVRCFLPADNEGDFFALPLEGKETCRAFAQMIVPEIASREFSLERVCWYCDTPTSDFLIDRIPQLQGILIATGGSGHGFKFLPVLGEEIVARLEGRLDPELSELWRWRSEEECTREWLGKGDASRGGPRGMKWETEIAR